MSVRKNITMSDKVYSDGAKRAKELFDGNFSAYLAHLVIQDAMGNQYKYGMIQNTNNKLKENPEVPDVAEEVKGEIDNILKM